MALDFIIVALPRSGTTWAANWLTGESVFCLHDPLWTMHYEDVDSEVARRARGRISGVSCTALWRWPDWLRHHSARKLILHRDADEVSESLARLGLPPMPDGAAGALERLEGKRADWTDLFDAARAARLWAWLTNGLPFDAERHAELVQCDIQPRLLSVKRDWQVNRKLGAEILARRKAGQWQYL